MKKQALIKFLNLTEEQAEDLKVSPYNDNLFEYCNEEYEVLTDEEANERWDEELDNYLEEYIYAELPEDVRCYFDYEEWKRDERFEGRGHSLAHYDGEENTETIDGETFYIYRQK